MNDPRHPLTAEVRQSIRTSAFPQVTAEAAGIPARVFDAWMRFGRARRPVPLYRDFLEAVLQALAGKGSEKLLGITCEPAPNLQRTCNEVATREQRQTLRARQEIITRFTTLT